MPVTDVRRRTAPRPVGLHWVGADGTILWANRTELKLLGYSAEEYVGRHIAEFHADSDVAEDILRRFSRNESLHDYRTRLRAKDGSIKHVLIGSGVLWSEGDLVHTRCIVRDISDQARAESEREQGMDTLRRSHALLTAVFDGSSDALSVKDQEGRYLMVNTAAARLVGRAAADILGNDDAALVPQDLARRLVAEDRLVLGAARGRTVEEVWAVAGVPRTYLTTRFPWREATGAVGGVVAASRDITDRKRAEALRTIEKTVLEHLVRGKALSSVLDLLAREIERLSPAMLVTILVLDRDDTHLMPGAAPSVPAAWTRSIAGLAIGPNVGSSGTAVHRRATVVVADIASDPLWVGYRGALRYGLRACWSVPVIALDGRSLGSFAVYYREPRRPTDDDLALIREAADVTRIAMEHHR